MGKLLSEAAEYLRQKHRRAIWMRVVIGLACIVVFCTTYALILPAVTLENTTCGLEEHVHTDACYTQAPSNEGKKLICSLETLGIHTHSSSCFDSEGNVLCGYADFVVHTHDESCYDQDGTLICPLPEVKEHIHTDACYSEAQEVIREKGHTHTEDCYATEQGELNCPLEESEGHTHGEDCYTTGQDELICPLEESDEHTHGEDCYAAGQKELSCPLEESEGHTHGEACYEQERVLVCGQEEQPDQIEKTEPELICGQEEIQLHTHTSECYTNDVLTCGRQEIREHAHTEDCFEVSDVESDDGRVLTCGMEEHTHDENCAVVQSGVMLAETEVSSETAQSIFAYTSEKNGATASINVADSKNHPIQPDAEGIYHVVADQDYLVQLVVESSEGMDPGLYYCTFPEGQVLKADGGDLVLENKTSEGGTVTIGRWYIDHATNRLMFQIDDSIKNYTNFKLAASVTVLFQESDELLDIDGGIKIKVEPNTEKQETELSKWARDKQDVENPDPNKIYWTVRLKGNRDSHIVGSEVSDTIQDTSTHYYTEDDMRNGITIEAHHYKPDGTNDESHTWVVKAGDPNLIWTESGWTYTMPDKAGYCKWHGETDESVGNDGWRYDLKYTSTVKQDGTGGYVTYKNTVTADGQTGSGSSSAGETDTTGAGIVKRGAYDNKTDKITWTFDATIPGAKGDAKYGFYWYLVDEMTLRNSSDEKLAYITNNIDQATVTAIIDGVKRTVPQLKEATENDPFCWEDHWQDPNTATQDGFAGHQINLYSRCTCTEATCPNWNGACTKKATGNPDFCSCWCTNKDITFTFEYQTDAKALIQNYGGLENQLHNSVSLNDRQYNPETKTWTNHPVDHDSKDVLIPGIFTKTNPVQPNGDNKVAGFTITVNEAMKDLSQGTDQSQGYETVTIKDTMSKTLVFQPLTLTIIEEGKNGHKRTLEETTDYTVEYDSSGEMENVAEIKLLHPGAYKYTLTYDASIYTPVGSANTYENKAEVELFGQKYKDETESTVIPNISSSGENYSVQLYKTDSVSDDPLKGAVFGLYDSYDNPICTVKTEENGKVLVQTDTDKKILFYEHTPCYFQEQTAPEGYKLDTTKYWFWFCNLENEQNCRLCGIYEIQCNDEEDGSVGQRIHSAQENSTENIIKITNEKREQYELPETGGFGTGVYTFGGIALISGALVCGRNRRRKRNV